MYEKKAGLESMESVESVESVEEGRRGRRGSGRVKRGLEREWGTHTLSETGEGLARDICGDKSSRK